MAINYQVGNDVVVTGAFAPFMKTLQQNYLYEQEKQQQERKEANALKAQAQKDLAKINPNGIWEGDAKIIGKSYDEIKDLNFQMEKAKTPEEKRMKSLEIQSKVAELTNVIANSKDFKKGWLDQYNRVPTQIGKMDTSKAVSYLDSAKGKSSSELGSDYLTGINDFYYKYDETKEMAEFRRQASAFVKNSSNFTTDDSDLKSVTRGQRTYQEGVVRYLPNENKIFEITSNFFKSSPERESMLTTYMERNQITDRNQAIAKFATDNKDLFTKPDKEERINTSKGGIEINMPNPFGSNTEKSQAIRKNAKLFTFRDKNGKVIGEYIAPTSMALNKTQSLSGVIEGRDPYTGQRVRFDNPKNAEVFGIFEDVNGGKLMQVRISDEYGDEQVIISPNINSINRAELSKKELQYLQGYEADVKERKSSTPQQTNNKQNSSNKPKFN